MSEIFPSGIDYAGSVPVKDADKFLGSSADGFISDVAVLTDGSPSRTYVIDTANIKDIFFDVLADKGGTIVVTPMIDVDDATTLGQVSETGTFIADVGFRAKYTDIASVKVQVVVTKTEGGDMTEYTFRVRGSVD